MKKMIVLIMLVWCGIQLANAENKQYVGVQVGYSQPTTRLNLPISGKEKELTPTIYNGFKVGVVYDATLVAGFGYSLGLNYTFGAHKTDWEQIGSLTYPRKQILEWYHQLEIPVDWQYKFEIAKNTWLMLYTGPTIQCGLAFKQNTSTQNSPNAEAVLKKDDRYTMDNNFALKRINVTWGVGAGFQYKNYFLRGGYDFGIINPYKAQTFNMSDEYHPYTRGRFDQWQIKLGAYLWAW